jgi:hypothetical protein
VYITVQLVFKPCSAAVQKPAWLLMVRSLRSYAWLANCIHVQWLRACSACVHTRACDDEEARLQCHTRWRLDDWQSSFLLRNNPRPPLLALSQH